MINIVSFIIAAVVYLFTWSMGVHGLTAALLPALILVIGAAIYTYVPLAKKSIHRERP